MGPKDRFPFLVELLVVITVIGVLAAIALPTFLGQSKKAQDADAKSNAHRVYGLVERCLQSQDRRDVGVCDSKTELADDSVSLGSDRGEVNVGRYPDVTNEYRVEAYSHSGGAFRIARWTTGVTRSCSKPGVGGCRRAAGQTQGTW
jgi:type IV pilus assembly protein PilA